MMSADSPGTSPDSVHTRIVFACIVLASVGIALVWMLGIPIFQEPDENAHFDYAYQLYSVGRPYRVERATCSDAKDVTPAVRYLERWSDFYGLRLLDDARVPAGYGGANFVKLVDRSAPARVTQKPASGAAAPCVMFTYPAGFYTAAALLIAGSGYVTNGSLVFEFFCVRALGIVCLAVTLPLAYQLLRAHAVSTHDALLATAAIGCFPLTSWMSGCVQPDNLTFTLVTLALFLATRVRRDPHDPIAALALVSVISLLCFIKQQYAAALYAACLMLVVPHYMRRFAFVSVQKATIAVVWLLPLIALRVATYATPVGSLRIAPHLAPTALVPAEATPFATAGLIAAYGARAAFDAFLSGSSLHRFWNAFGWKHDAFFPDPHIDRAVEQIIGVASLTIALMLFSRFLTIGRRCLYVARHRSPVLAFQLIGNDVVVNTYVLWTGLLIVVCAASRGTWGLQGRYWLPVMAPMMLLLTRTAPRSLPHRARATMVRLGVLAMFGYAIVSAPFALAASYARYYRPSGAQARATVVAVDGTFLQQRPTNARRIIVRRGDIAVLRGLAFQSTDGSLINHVSISIDDRHPIGTRYGFAVPTSVAPMPGGFEGRIPTESFRTGRHRLRIFAYVDSKHFESWNGGLTLDVVADSHAFLR